MPKGAWAKGKAKPTMPVVPLDEWKDAARQGQRPPEGVIRKTPDTEIKQVEEESRVLRFVISTGTPDRDRDVITPEGWDLRHYKKNPIIAWSHSYVSELPIARAKKIRVEDGKLVAEAEFAPAEFNERYNPLAESVFQMLKAGFLNATSVGFKPKKYAYNEDRRGVDFFEQELLEFSVCALPSNPDCLVEARAAGIDVEPIREWAKAILESGEPQQKLEADDQPVPPFSEPKRKSFMGYEQWGYTTPNAGTTAPAHVHDYSIYLHHAEDGTMTFDGGEAYKVADHCHRITLAGLQRGETEEADGHRHGLMTAGMREQAMAILAGEKGFKKDLSPGNVSSEVETQPQLDIRQIVDAVLAELDKQEGWTVQSILFPKAHWDSAGACRDWLKEHDFKSSDLDETDDHYRFRQRDPDDFRRMRMVCLMPNDAGPGEDRCRIKAIGGPLKAAEVPQTEGPPGDAISLELERVENDEWVLTVEDDDPREVYAIDPEDVRAALAEVVGAGVRQAINTLKGRVD